MHVSLADQYQERRSLWHVANPKAKLIVTLGTIITISLAPAGHWAGLALVLCAIWASALSARLNLGWLLKRSLLVLPFVLAAVPLPFTTPGHIVGVLPVLGWPISQEGVLRMAGILSKSWLSVQVALLLVASTRFYDILWGLHGLRVPRVLIAVVSLMYRYTFVLADEATRMRRARAARSATLPGRRGPGIVWRARVAGNMIGLLFVRAIERSERVYAAMLARGYQGEIQLLEPPVWRPADTILVAGASVVLALSLLIGSA